MADYDIRSRRYQIENSIFMGMTLAGKQPPRPAAMAPLDGDWICEYLGVSFAEYYSEFEFQYECRVRASEAAKAELGVGIPVVPDFGSVLDPSIYGGEVVYPENAPPSMEPAIESPEQVPELIEKMRRERDILSLGLAPKMLEWRDRIKEIATLGTAGT